MRSEIDSLQERVDAIRATGDQQLMHMTFLVLGRELRAFFNKKLKRKNFKRFTEPVTQREAEWLLSDLQDKRNSIET
jgi:hypothetical protein